MATQPDRADLACPFQINICIRQKKLPVTTSTIGPAATPTVSSEAPKIEVTRRGATMVLNFNRPKALNAFDEDMRSVMASEIPKIARNPDIYIVLLTSASEKAFCAGGDVRALTALARSDLNEAKRRFADEYRLDWLLECFSKPTVSFINGICMGSGAGLTSYNTHRIAGDGYKFAMPETAIGLFPDVGLANVYARMPWPVGLYLGLTGRVLTRADAYWLGLATHCIDAAEFSAIQSALADAQTVDPLLDGLHRDPGPSALRAEFGLIARFFGGGNLRRIVADLENADAGTKQWADKTLADLRTRSPLSLHITDRHIRAARHLDLRQTLIQDYRLAARCLDGEDFIEGVRAALVDKDHKPCWQHAAIEDVTDEEVDAYFEPLPSGDLALASREAMQAARV